MRKRTAIELLLIFPLLGIGIQVWYWGINRPAHPEPPEESADAPPRVQDLIRRTPVHQNLSEPLTSTRNGISDPHTIEADPSALLTLQILEADGSIPEDTIIVFSPDGTIYEAAPLGQLVLSTDPGTLTLQASANNGTDLRLSKPHTLRLEPGERHTLLLRLLPPQQRSHSPGFALIPGDIFALITEIVPESPAQLAGLQPGDAVMAVDGVPTASLNTPELEALLFRPDNEPLRLSLILQHDNGTFEEVEALVPRLTLP